jgi:hypothetical protein
LTAIVPAPVGRGLACLLLAAICVDIVGDATCDAPPPVAPSATVLADLERGPSRSPEPCAEVCVPDCFCCSRSVAADPAVVPPRPVGLTRLATPASEHGAAGWRPPVDHPPLLVG